MAGSSTARAAAATLQRRCKACPCARAAAGGARRPAAAASPTGGAAPSAEALAEQQAAAEAARAQRELLEMQNKVLMEQVEQMQKMMAAQQMSMQSFMANFPQAPDEAERRLVLLKKRLMDAPRAEFARVDDVCRNIIESGQLDDACRAVMVNVIGESEQRTLSMCLVLDDGEIITAADLPEAMVEQRASRKGSMCQYVAASGEYKCFRADRDAGLGECFMLDVMSKGMDLANADPALSAAMKSLMEADPVFAKNMGEVGAMMPLMAKEGELDELPVMRRVSTKVQRGLMKGVLSAASGTNTGQLVKWMTATMASEDMVYLGAPVKCEGRTMGSFCTIFAGGVSDDVEVRLKEKLMRAARRVGDLLDEL